MEDDLWWKTTFYGRWPLMKDDLWWKTTFNRDTLWLAWPFETIFNYDIFPCDLCAQNCHTQLHLGFSGEFKVWQVSACKRKPQHGIILNQERPTHPHAYVVLATFVLMFFKLKFLNTKFDWKINLLKKTSTKFLHSCIG